MPFFTYYQNNSGGSFEVNHNLDEYVIIDAESPEEADKKAQEIGIYFNGVNEGVDCDCCGDRWRSYANEFDQPTVYGDIVDETTKDVKIHSRKLKEQKEYNKEFDKFIK